MGCCGGESQFTRQQWFILVIIGSVHFASAICISLQAPFYPEEAESKNATATEYGFVFGIFELASFICSPLLGNFMDHIGAKFLLNTGIFLAGICSILFGLLDMVKGHVSFIVLSFVVRVFEAVGSSAAVTSAFAITAATFPNNMATTFATLEIFYGVGYIVGPTLGGILFALGGYMLPFIFMGTLLVIDGILIFWFMPSFNRNAPSECGRLFEIIKVPAVLLDSLSITSLSICAGFYSATLEPHIREFELTPVSLGFVFIVHGATYAVTAPIVGRLCDSRANPRHLILFGNIMVITSVLLVGPAPFLPIEPTLPTVIVGLIFLGLGMGCILVSAFTDAIRSAVAHGFPDDIVTYGLVAGLWAASFSLGDFIGPSVAGALDDWVGFRWGSLFVIVVHVIMFSAMFIFVNRQGRTRRKYTNLTSEEGHLGGRTDRKDSEREPLNRAADDWTPDEYGSCKNNGQTFSTGLGLQTVKA